MVGTKKIPLYGKRGLGKYTLVDEDDYEKYATLRWHLSDTGYVVRKSNHKTQRLHRLILNAPEKYMVDHKNGNPLDNRKANLRCVTAAENAKNRHGVRGVCYDKSKRKHWMVRYRGKFCGRYATEEEALRAFQLAKSGVEYIPRRRKRYMLPKGVAFYKGYKRPYVVRPTINGKRYFLGFFANASEAKVVYDNFLAEKRIAS